MEGVHKQKEDAAVLAPVCCELLVVVKCCEKVRWKLVSLLGGLDGRKALMKVVKAKLIEGTNRRVNGDEGLALPPALGSVTPISLKIQTKLLDAVVGGGDASRRRQRVRFQRKRPQPQR